MSNSKQTAMDILRWVGILPVAIFGYFAIQIVFALMATISGFSDWYAQFLNSIAGSYYFVWAGAKVAPKHNFFVAVILAVIHAAIIGSAFTLAAVYQPPDYPLWWLGVSSIIGIISTVVACVQLKDEEDTLKRHEAYKARSEDEL